MMNVSFRNGGFRFVRAGYRKNVDNKYSKRQLSCNEKNQSLHAENATLKEEMALMQSQLDWFKKQMFGRKSEQSSVIIEGGEQLSLMPDEKAASEKDLKKP